MKSITIHNLEDKLENLIREKAKKSGTSLNKTIQILLKQSLGLTSQNKNYPNDDFIEFFGKWTEADESEFNSNTKYFQETDVKDWK